MALPTWTRTFNNLYATTLAELGTDVINQIFDRVPLFDMLKTGGYVDHVDGSLAIQHPLEYGVNESIQGISKHGTVDIVESEFLTDTKYDWRYITGHVRRSHIEERQCRGKYQRLAIVQQKLKNFSNSLAAKWEYWLLKKAAGAEPKVPHGLQDFLPTSNTTGVVGNISRAVETWWRHQSTDMAAYSTAAMLEGKMETMFNDCGNIAGGDRQYPDLMVTDQTSYEAYKANVDNIQRISLSPTGKWAKIIDLGVGDIAFRGQPVIYSTQTTAGYMYFLNSTVLKLTIDEGLQFEIMSWIAPENQPDTLVGHALLGANLTTNCLQKLGLLYGINTIA